LSTRETNSNKVSRTTDIFDYCPFEPPDPWDKSILKHMDVKYGYLRDCTPDQSLSPVTDLENGKVFLKKGQKDFVCRAWPTTETHLNPKNNPDVVLMVIDSVASTQLIRALPRTVNFLLHGMDAIEFRKFNKVGSNSRPNAFAALVGKTTEAITRKMMNLPTVPADLTYDQYCRHYLDNESYIPLMYQRAGYKMFGAEDYVSSILNYPNCLGTKTRQFQHSYRPLHTRLNRDKHMGNVHLKGSCRLVHNNMLDYLGHYVNAYEGSPKFSLTWLVDLAHDNTKLLYRSDYDLYDFYLKNRDALNNSFIFFFGDHGPRFG
ncbi:hypothetical protein OSTOST_10454, partial [Ostertagia ostertagi]